MSKANLKIVSATHAPIPTKVECDMVAAEIAIKARAECIRRAAKFHVDAQIADTTTEGRIAKDNAYELEEYAREWQRKAYEAEYPVTEWQARGLLERVRRECDEEEADKIGEMFSIVVRVKGGITEGINPTEVWNACVDALNYQHFDPTE